MMVRLSDPLFPRLTCEYRSYDDVFRDPIYPLKVCAAMHINQKRRWVAKAQLDRGVAE